MSIAVKKMQCKRYHLLLSMNGSVNDSQHLRKCTSITSHKKSVDIKKTIVCDERYIRKLNDNKKEEIDSNNKPRFNEIGIQMISSCLHKRLFGQRVANSDDSKIRDIFKQLNSHDLKISKTANKNSNLSEVNIDKHLPELFGDNLLDHFEILGHRYSDKYKELALLLIGTNTLPLPKQWSFTEGWTRYTVDCDGNTIAESVSHPLENDTIIDIEVCMHDSDGRKPTLATALSSKAWYSWCSNRLINCHHLKYSNKFAYNSKTLIEDLIPMGYANEVEKLIVGHNVSFDRSFLKEQYSIETDKTRFIDTMSIHMCISGLTQHQRALSYSSKIKANGINDLISNNNLDSMSPLMWNGVGSLNNLIDVYNLYCDKTHEHSKDQREIFIKGTLNDVYENFNDLMTYCATDVILTHDIFKSTFPLFLNRFPNPVTLAGMLEMSIMYLPVITNNWNRYTSEAQSIFDDQERELNLSLREIANKSCSLLKNDRYKNDVWLWDLDWTTHSVRFKKPKIEKIKKINDKNIGMKNIVNISENEDLLISERIVRILSTAENLKKVQPLLPGYPRWFAEFCVKPKCNTESNASLDDFDWEPGPYQISTQMRSVPKLMRLMWHGFPIHYDDKYGWGYLVPDLNSDDITVSTALDNQKNLIYFPLNELKRIVNETNQLRKTFDYSSEDLYNCFEENENLQDIGQTKGIKDIIEGCLFYKLPHKGGPTKRVGNPLAKDFLQSVENESLTSYNSDITNLVLQQTKKLSYWKNASKRIRSQLVVAYDSINGAILPRVVVSGTVTRRAVEPTWLTASNAVEDRLGSELKAMIQCPDNYSFVGADVDSQELWIASLIGDSHFSRIHGSTGIGWMTLQGSKANATDMHSKTASLINISRDQAKVLNYARIYGSGQPFATRFLMQTDPNLTLKEAKDKAKTIFAQTKGKKKKLVKTDQMESDVGVKTNKSEWHWIGGTESHMFNKLEAVASSDSPRTPFLDCRISRALEPSVVKDDYITSRINWVVQSSAVDFLHLLLVSMKWLFEDKNIEGRFCISIHDEVRYLVKSEHKYKAALALQLSNLLTRAFFSCKLGLHDLPLSVAYFSAVDIDKCLRKEVHQDCKTPSNPLGLKKGYRIPFGESLDIFQLINKLK